MITMIAAAAENNALGKDNELVWHLPDDFKRFKALTIGHDIIMGRKTLESFPKLLPSRHHIVLTRDSDYRAPEGVTLVSSMDEALTHAGKNSSPFIIGGAEIYRLGMDYAEKIELTRVHGTFEADAFFPEIDPNQWELVHEEYHPVDDKHAFAFTYQTFIRRD